MKDLAQFFKVLAEPARLELLWLLANHRELCVCDLMAALGITQSKASRHLATLRHAGLVADRREAAWSYYSLRPVEGQLERAVLETLRKKLGAHPGAAAVLGTLHAAMTDSRRPLACAVGGACPTDGRAPRSSKRRLPAKRNR